MDRTWFRPADAGPWAASRQAAVLLTVAGVVNLVLAGLAAQPHPELLLGAGNFGLAALARFLPWRRWRPLWQLVLLPLGLALIAVATATSGGFATGNAPYLVLIHAWLGLNFPRGVTVGAAPLTTLSYLVPLLLVVPTATAVAHGVVLLPVCVLVGLVVSVQIEAQRRDRDRIAQIERWRAALTTTLAHDLRSPLATMQAAVEMVRDEADDLSAGERERLLANVQRQITRMHRLSTNLLDLERVDACGRLRLDRAPVDVAAAVAQAVDSIGGAGVTCAVPAGLVVDADPERLQQMLVNLVGNALRHGRPPVVVRAEGVPGWVSIEVRDHGPGIAAEQRARLFSRFATDGGGHDVGLGLWIVDQLARAHGGRVRYEPAQPGARLVLMLPQLGDAPREP